MTILEALQNKAGKNNTATIEVILLERNLNGSVEYTPSNRTQYKEVELARADVLETLASAPDFSEADLSIKYDRDAMRQEANRIREKFGIKTKTSPTVNGTARW